MHFVDREYVRKVFNGKRVAIVGSGPGCLDNQPNFVESHDLVVRVNNYDLSIETGFRTDVFYSYFGGAIRKTAKALQSDGVKLCLCKCPDAKFMESEWHRKNHKPHGVDFRYIYESRKDWWFCPTYIPSLGEFLDVFTMLGKHIPSTGFSALLEVRQHEPASIYLTGFDFFASRIHNVSEAWRPGNPDDPIGHAPERERQWVNEHREGITMDKKLTEIMEQK